jgi:hypothetical protein
MSIMTTTQISSKIQKYQHVKCKDRFRVQIYLGTPQVPVNNKQHQQKHELLSDWEDAS